MRVCLHQYSLLVEDLAAAFRALGAEVALCGRCDHQGVISRDPQAIFQAVEDGAELVVLFNGVGLDDEGALMRELVARGVPVAFWWVDDPLEPFSFWDLSTGFAGDAACLGAPSVRHFITEASWLRGLRSQGALAILELPLAFSEAMRDDSVISDQRSVTSLKPQAPSPRSQASSLQLPASSLPPDCEVFFAGTLQGDQARQLEDQVLRARYPGCEDLFAAALEGLQAAPMLPVEVALRQAQARWGVTLEPATERATRELHVALRRIATSVLRATVARALAERFDLRVMGDEDWRTVIDADRCLPRAAHGPLLAACYRRAAIVIDIPNLQLRHGLNQRVFDVPAAGGALVTAARPALDRCFPDAAPGAYDSTGRLLTLVEAALSDQDGRRERARQTRDFTLARHHFRARAETILAAFGLSAPCAPLSP